MLPNIVLIGFMGSGKSSVGRRIATQTGHRFVDTDELVATRAGRSITRIFAEEGEEHFRDLEAAVLAELTDSRDIVLATGGGIILRSDNQDMLRRIGPVVWLDANPDTLFDRVARNKKRPLLQTPDPRASFDALLASRRAIYEAASDLRVDSSDRPHEEVARDLVERVRGLPPAVAGV